MPSVVRVSSGRCVASVAQHRLRPAGGGGGITGAGVALDAASRGLRTALVERHDFAVGHQLAELEARARRSPVPRPARVPPGVRGARRNGNESSRRAASRVACSLSSIPVLTQWRVASTAASRPCSAARCGCTTSPVACASASATKDQRRRGTRPLPHPRPRPAQRRVRVLRRARRRRPPHARPSRARRRRTARWRSNYARGRVVRKTRRTRRRRPDPRRCATRRRSARARSSTRPASGPTTSAPSTRVPTPRRSDRPRACTSRCRGSAWATPPPRSFLPPTTTARSS